MPDDAIQFAAGDPAHAEAASELIYATGREVFDFVYGGKERCMALLARLCAEEDGIFGAVHTSAAYEDGRLVALEHGFDLATRTRHERVTAGHLRALLTREEYRHVAWADDILSIFFLPTPETAYYLQNLSVLPELRGRGLGERLLQHAFETAAAAGYETVELDVSITNPAVRFYTRAGMEIAHELRHAEHERAHGLKGQYRMVKRLA